MRKRLIVLGLAVCLILAGCKFGAGNVGTDNNGSPTVNGSTVDSGNAGGATQTLENEDVLGSPYSLENYTTDEIYDEVMALLDRVPEIGTTPKAYNESAKVSTTVVRAYNNSSCMSFDYYPVKGNRIDQMGVGCVINSENKIESFATDDFTGYIYVELTLYEQATAEELYQKFASFFAGYYAGVTENKTDRKWEQTYEDASLLPTTDDFLSLEKDTNGHYILVVVKMMKG